MACGMKPRTSLGWCRSCLRRIYREPCRTRKGPGAALVATVATDGAVVAVVDEVAMAVVKEEQVVAWALAVPVVALALACSGTGTQPCHTEGI